MKKIKRIVWDVLDLIHLGGFVQLGLKSMLDDDGWFRSFRTKKAEGKNGEPIPWCTYPFIKFIEPRLHKEMSVFEYGCGNSTRWYAKRVKEVQAVEHHKGWFDQVSNQLPNNSSVSYVELEYDGAYSQTVLTHNKQYDIVIVDGRDRNNCAKQALSALKPDGILVFDNTERKNYKTGIDLLTEAGFKRIDFIGLSPVTAHENMTSVFYRKENCLGI